MSADKLPACLQATEDDIQLLLAAQCHIGTKNCDKTMEPYVYKRRADGELAWRRGVACNGVDPE
jgi:small subunit ribosomal protein SAe